MSQYRIESFKTPAGKYGLRVIDPGGNVFLTTPAPLDSALRARQAAQAFTNAVACGNFRLTRADIKPEETPLEAGKKTS